jgi:hypothetical protein
MGECQAGDCGVSCSGGCDCIAETNNPSHCECRCDPETVVSSAKLEWLTLDTVVNYDAQEVPLVTLAKAVEGRYPGRTAIRSALVDSRVTIRVENIRFDELLEKVGLVVLEDSRMSME